MHIGYSYAWSLLLSVSVLILLRVTSVKRGPYITYDDPWMALYICSYAWHLWHLCSYTLMCGSYTYLHDSHVWQVWWLCGYSYMWHLYDTSPCILSCVTCVITFTFTLMCDTCDKFKRAPSRVTVMEMWQWSVKTEIKHTMLNNMTCYQKIKCGTIWNIVSIFLTASFPVI